MMSRNVAASHEQEYDAFPRKPVRHGGDLNSGYKIIRWWHLESGRAAARRENNKIELNDLVRYI